MDKDVANQTESMTPVARRPQSQDESAGSGTLNFLLSIAGHLLETVGLLTAILYRSRARHGPDQIGDEVGLGLTWLVIAAGTHAIRVVFLTERGRRFAVSCRDGGIWIVVVLAVIAVIAARN